MGSIVLNEWLLDPKALPYEFLEVLPLVLGLDVVWQSMQLPIRLPEAAG
jgi:hypothetical protein